MTWINNKHETLSSSADTVEAGDITIVFDNLGATGSDGVMCKDEQGYYAHQIGTSHSGIGVSVNRISFMLKKVGSPTGNMKAKIYTGSVEGTGNQGSHKTVAATSTTTLDISTLTTSYAEVVFEFSSDHTVAAGDNYSLEMQSGTDVSSTSKCVKIGYNTSSISNTIVARAPYGSTNGSPTTPPVFYYNPLNSGTASLAMKIYKTGSSTAMTASDFNMFLFSSFADGQNGANGTYNNNSNSVYATRYSFDGDADGTQTSQTQFWNYWGGTDSADRFNVGYFSSISGEERYGMVWGADTRGSTASPHMIETINKFVPSPDATITSLKFTNTNSGSYASGTNLSCVGDGGTKTLTFTPTRTNTIYEETDTAKYKWWDGSAWQMDGTEAKVFRGIFAGGYDESSNASNVIDYITIPSTGNATDFGDLSVTRAWAGGGSNGTRGVFMGGRASSYLNTIDYVTITTPSNATDFGDLNNNMGYSNETACSDTRVVQAGGLDNGEYSNVMDYVTTATTGNATDFGDINGSAGGYGFCGLSNGTKGYFAGCRISGGMNPSFFHITIATTGNAVDTNYDLQHSNMWAGSGASEQGGSRGLIFAGYRHTGTNASINDIQYISLPISAHASDFGDLSASTESGMAVAGDGRAVYAHKGLTSDISQYVTIATTGNAVNFGTLTEARSHGGSTEGY